MTKEVGFSLKLEPELRDAFMAAAQAAHRPAAQLVREFMRSFIAQQDRHAFEVEARRQSLVIARAARDPTTDEYAIMKELEADLEGMDTDDERSA